MSSCQRAVQLPLPAQGPEKGSPGIYSGRYIPYPNPSYRQDCLCLESYLDKPSGGGERDAEWVRLWLPKAEVMLDSSLPLMPHIQFITHFVGFTFKILKKPSPFSLLLTLPDGSSCPHFSPGSLQSHLLGFLLHHSSHSLSSTYIESGLLNNKSAQQHLVACCLIQSKNWSFK